MAAADSTHGTQTGSARGNAQHVPLLLSVARDNSEPATPASAELAIILSVSSIVRTVANSTSRSR